VYEADTRVINMQCAISDAAAVLSSAPRKSFAAETGGRCIMPAYTEGPGGHFFLSARRIVMRQGQPLPCAHATRNFPKIAYLLLTSWNYFSGIIFINYDRE
jgi:hypothetical protein